jgi:dienelactone hydrolase
VINRTACPAIVAILLASPAIAQTAPTRAQTTFVVTQASDTLAIERVTRAAGHVDSELAMRGQGINLRFEMHLAAQDLVSSMEFAVRLANATAAAPPAQAGKLTFRGDTVIAEVTAPGRATQRVGAKTGVMPFVNLSMATAEQLVRRARTLGGARVEVPMFAVGGGQVVPAIVTWPSRDSAVITLGGVDLRAAVAPDGRVLGAIVPVQNVRFTRIEGATAVSMTTTPPDYSAPAGAPYTAEEVTVRSTGGVVLAGTLTLPKDRGGDGRAPAVVLITGSGQQNRDEELPGIKGYRFFRQIADTLSRRGIAVLRLDDRGIGGSQPGDRPGTSGDFADDVRAALAYLRARPEIDGNRLGLVGHSEGGLIAPMVARNDPRLRAIALLAAPSRSIRRILEFQRRVFVENDTAIAVSKRDSVLTALTRIADSAAATPGWLQYVYDYDPRATAREVRTPVLILHGATDLQVTADQVPELAAALREGGNRDVTTHVFPNTNHLFLDDPSGVYSGYSRLPSMTVKPEVLGRLTQWLVAKLGGR